MLTLKRISLFFTAIISLTFLFSCNTDTIKELENRILELENQAPDTVFVTSTDTLIITNTDTLYIANLDTLFIFDTVYLANDSVMIGDVRLFTQEMIDEFGASGIKKVVGRLEIQIEGSVSLLPLINLTDVVGRLILDLEGNSLEGLNNLVRVTNLDIKGVNSLIGLSSLESVENFSIGSEQLTNLDGIQSLMSVNTFGLSVGEAFTSFQGFPPNLSVQVLSINGGFDYYGSYGECLITSLTGLEGITNIRELEISGFKNLTDVSGLSNITELDQFSLSLMPALINLNGLSSLTQINEHIGLGVGSEFESLSALNGIELIGNVSIYNNEFDPDTYANIPNNVLTSLAGLTNIAGVTGFGVSGFYSLNDISSLSSLPTEMKSISIGTTAITNLDPLAHITKFTGTQEYPFEPVGMSIDNNPNLTNFCGVKTAMEYMEGNSVGYSVNGNAFNPQSAAEIVGCN